MRPVDDGVGVEADDEVVPVLAALLQEGEVPDVEEVEGAGHVHDPVALLGPLHGAVPGGLGLTSQLENSSSFWVVGRNWLRPGIWCKAMWLLKVVRCSTHLSTATWRLLRSSCPWTSSC